MTTSATTFTNWVEWGERYWAESRRPLASLIFTAPLLLIYEIGVLSLGRYAVRNGAEAWLRQLLDLLGLGQYFLLPVLTICILLGWHHLTRQPWRVSPGVFSGMACECLALAFGLQVLAWLLGILMQRLPGIPVQSIPAAPSVVASTLGSVAGFLGAGVYEELLFRMILLPLSVGLFRWLRLGPHGSVVGGSVLSSLLFAAAHHLGPAGEAFSAFKFLFRCVAGGGFSLLFLYRGFGIAAGTHAGYDLLVGLSLLP